MFKMSELVILKFGGSAITRKKEGVREVRKDVLDRLCWELAEAKKERGFGVVVVHGAGPFGHVPASDYGLSEGLKSERQVVGFSLTHQSMEELNAIGVDSLIRHGLNAVAYQPSALGILRKGRLSYLPTKVLIKLLGIDMVPVAYGDVLIDEVTGINILSGDHLVPYLARELHADRVILLTDVGGVFDLDPEDSKDAVLVKEITPGNIDLVCKVSASKGTDVTGGMRRKLDELIGLTQSGIESEIVSALEPGILKRALLGERGLGTLIRG